MRTTYTRKGVAAELRRKGVDTTGSFSLELSPVRLKMENGSTVTVDFVKLNDSTLGITESTVWSHLATRPVKLSGAIDSVFVEGIVRTRALNRIRGQASNAHRLTFEVVDAGTEEVLVRIGKERSFSSNGKYSIGEKGRLVNLANREVYVRPILRGMVQGRKDIASTLVHVYTITDTLPSVPKHPGDGSLARDAHTRPERYLLHPAYPNPFSA